MMTRSNIFFRGLLGIILLGLGLSFGAVAYGNNEVAENLPQVQNLREVGHTNEAAGQVGRVERTETQQLQSDEADEAAKQKVIESYGKLPLYFIENKGQLDPQVKYYTKTAGQTLYFTQEKIVFDLFRKVGNGKWEVGSEKEEKSEIRNPKSEIERLAFSLRFLGANKGTEIEAGDVQAGQVNYLIGNDRGKWQANIPTYKEVLYKDIYPGIDLKLYGNHQELEYDLIVSPGAHPEDIRFGYEGIEGLTLSEEKEMLIKTAFGELKQKRPVIYQEIDGEKVEVEGRFRIQNSEFGSQKSEKLESAFRIPHSAFYTYGFEVAAYNPDYPLIIDPTLAYSTYLGGSGDDEGNGYDQGYAIAVDSSGAAYITGQTGCTNFPTQNAIYGSHSGGWSDVFVTKIAADGSGLAYSTYLGGGSNEEGYGIAVDSSGAAYITGRTDSSDFPTQNAIYDSHSGSYDAFVTKINAAGSGLDYSTYLGGSNYEQSQGIAVDSSGAAYVTGRTDSSDFPTQNAIDSSLSGWSDAFVTKINAAGSGLTYSTYLGGGSNEEGYGIAV
ncbi:MAG: SBBP repeat-containing protein, partial [bacterium]|nr:SBBP repeat-containing protein [bacterium]